MINFRVIQVESKKRHDTQRDSIRTEQKNEISQKQIFTNIYDGYIERD